MSRSLKSFFAILYPDRFGKKSEQSARAKARSKLVDGEFLLSVLHGNGARHFYGPVFVDTTSVTNTVLIYLIGGEEYCKTLSNTDGIIAQAFDALIMRFHNRAFMTVGWSTHSDFCPLTERRVARAEIDQYAFGHQSLINRLTEPGQARSGN